MSDVREILETHLTILARDEQELLRFQEFCQQRNLKCVHIVLSRGDQVSQPMATYRESALLTAAIDRGTGLVAELQEQGFEVSRLKIEGSPFHELAPLTAEAAATRSPANYFEHHIKLRLNSNDSREQLLQVATEHGGHLSRNAFKTFSTGEEERFVTLRHSELGRDASLQRCRQLQADLQQAEFSIAETESEYCLYDSHVGLDRGWL